MPAPRNSLQAVLERQAKSAQPTEPRRSPAFDAAEGVACRRVITVARGP